MGSSNMTGFRYCLVTLLALASIGGPKVAQGGAASESVVRLRGAHEVVHRNGR